MLELRLANRRVIIDNSLRLSFIPLNFRDVLIANARGWVNAAGVEFNTDILDLVGRKWWAWADDIV